MAEPKQGAGELSTQRTLDVLVYLSRRAQPVPAEVIARDCSIPRSSVYRMLRVMERLHFVVHLEEDRLWGLGIRAFEIGSGYLRSDALERTARPLLARLTQQTGHTSHLAVLHGADVLYLLKHTTAEPSRPLITAVGVRLPAHLTAVGRAMLSSLPEPQVRATLAPQRTLVTRTGKGPRRMSDLKSLLREDRARGYSVESGATTDEVSCVAAAVFNHEGMPIAAVGVSYFDDLDDHERDHTALAVTETSHLLTRRVRGTLPRRESPARDSARGELIAGTRSGR